jgi:calcineurin-like phosphoesterase family protein
MQPHDPPRVRHSGDVAFSREAPGLDSSRANRRRLALGAALAIGGAVSGAWPGGAAAASTDQVFRSVADGFVTQAAPRAEHGRARTLRVQPAPVSRAYLRFRVGGLRGGVASATLRVFVTSGHARVQVRPVTRRWSERTLSFRTAPGVGPVVARGLAQPGWVSFELGSAVRPAGVVQLALVATSGSVSVASRETSSKPRLRLELAPLLLAAGDIGSCRSGGDEATAALLEGVPATIAALGDLAYPRGTAADFADCYDPSWGPYRDRTRPAAGNHDFATPGAEPYFAYWGTVAGLAGAGYYSYELGNWHVVVLNSNCRFVACTPGSAQETWLRADLSAHPARCTLAYFHHPLFSSTAGTATPAVQPLWQDLYDAGADVVLNGHAHNYQRFAPQTPLGAPDPQRGIREFVVGTGGNSHHLLGPALPNQENMDDTTYGVLRLLLREGGYDWEFVPQAGGVFTDSGTGTCH